MIPRLKEYYQNKIINELQKEFSLKIPFIGESILLPERRAFLTSPSLRVPKNFPSLAITRHFFPILLIFSKAASRDTSSGVNIFLFIFFKVVEIYW